MAEANIDNRRELTKLTDQLAKQQQNAPPGKQAQNDEVNNQLLLDFRSLDTGCWFYI